MKTILTTLILLTITTNAIAIKEMQSYHHDSPEACQKFIKKSYHRFVDKGFMCSIQEELGEPDMYSCGSDRGVITLMCQGSDYTMLKMSVEEAKRFGLVL